MENAQLNKEEEEVVSPFQTAVKAGIVVGLVTLAIYYVAYFIDVEALSSAWIGFLLLGISLGLIIYFGIDYRRELGGFMSFGVAFQFVFITFVISGLISTLGNILLFQVIDPSLPGVLADAQLESTIALMDRFGAGNQITSDQMAEMRTSFEESRSVLGLTKAFGISLVIYAILALILGAIIKRRDKSLDY